MKTFNQISYGEYVKSEVAVTLRNSGGDCGGGSEVLAIDTPKVYCIGNGQVNQLKLSKTVGALNCMDDQMKLLSCIGGGETAQTIDASYYKGTGTRNGKEREVIAMEPVYMSDRKGHSGITEDGTATTLTAQEKERPIVGGGGAMTSVVRRLTPLE